MDGGGIVEPSLLKAGENCWRVETAPRFAMIMENGAYFEALASSLARARRSIVLLGWQFDPRTRLDSEGRAADPQGQIGHQLRALARARPELDIRILVWDSPLFIAASQGFYPHRGRLWFRRRMVDFRLDTPWAFGGCHHQKVVVIDDAVAFCGGGDVSTDRWDGDEHLDGDVRRYRPSGLIAPPRHEMMCVMDGPAARALGDLARERWRRAIGERTEPDEAETDPWPEGIEPDLLGARVGVARTEPASRGRPAVRENERLYLDAIRSARSLIYLENQYFTSPLIAEALARRLDEPDGPEIVLVSTGRSPSWFDSLTMDTARSEVLFRLEAADRHNRFYAFSPRTAGGERIIVHAKMAVFDDRVIRIGSTNLNNRSLGLDTECDVAAEPDTPAGREAIRRFRQRSIGHFLGVDGPGFGEVEAVMGSTGAAVLQFSGGRMATLGAEPPSAVERFVAEWQLGDPRGAEDAWRPWKRRNRSHRPA